ncbi:MAG TPA: PhoPQ-activated pathogenicity-related family protein [Bryobacteraceae bacterium]|nr:PhoPQ-activated pathogenicity-related family protein [Bryobacteraceae bacterium]
MIRPLALLAAFAIGVSAAAEHTALDRYVAAADPSFRWQLANQRATEAAAEYVLDMSSQNWRSKSEVDRTEWRHWVTIIIPKTVSSSTGFLFITGGANDGKMPAGAPANLRSMAIDTKSVVAELRMVPNQPLQFPGEPKGRVEDSFIAYTWDKFLRGGDEQWPARLPMTKSAVRAMDAVTQFCAGDQGGRLRVERFIVSGGSKRGWTTWVTAAVDRRVAGIVPIVIDALNVEKSFDHHFRALGFWAPAIKDYVEMGIVDWSGTPEYKRLMDIEDPYSYRDRYTMPKFMVNSAGDRFFLPDSSRFYFDDLRGEKYLRYVPNTDHSLRNSDAFESVHAYYSALLAGRARPKLTWKFEKDGAIRVKTNGQPTAVKLWQVTNPDARDFRLEKIGPRWQSSLVTGNGRDTYVARVAKPAKGWTAAFVELTYPSGGTYPFKFTTAVRVEPDTLPHPSPTRTRSRSAQ